MRRLTVSLDLCRERLGRLLWLGVPLVLGAAAAVLLLGAAGSAAHAAPLAPSNTLIFPGCKPTLQACIDAANVGDTVLIEPGSYNVALTLHHSVNITGVNSGTVILTAPPNQRVLTVDDPTILQSFVISGVTIAGGNASTLDPAVGSGAFISIPVVAEFDNVIFSNNLSATFGGGLFVFGDVDLTNVIFSHNTATYNGGGLDTYGAAQVNGGLFLDNQCLGATCAGGGLDVTGNLTANHTRFIGNSASMVGGGAHTTARVDIANSLFQGNSCLKSNCYAGGLLSEPDASHQPMTLSNTQFLSNSAQAGFGGVDSQLPTSISGGLFQNNSCSQPTCWGGALLVYQSSLALTGTQFISNSAATDGGAVYAYTATVSSALFENNQCTQLTCHGGGLYSVKPLTVTSDQFIGNAAGENGGGLYSGFYAVLTNDQFTQNKSGANGGGLYISDALLNGGLFQNNQCTQGGCRGGGVYSAQYIQLTGTQFISNAAGENGGGLFSVDDVKLADVQFSNNSSGSDGGGLDALYTSELTGGLFQGNHCLAGGCGGGGLFANALATIAGTQFIGNRAQGNGGGLEALQGTLVNGALFQSNHGQAGGGLYADNGAALTATQFVSNTASGLAGGLAVFAGDTRVVNSLFAGNTAGVGSGALTLGLGSAGTDTVLYTTLAGGSGAGIDVLSGTVGVADSIISGYTVGISVTAGTGSESHNLFFGNGSNTAGGVTASGGSLTANPQFASPATGNYHLTSGSPALGLALDVGVTTDIDGDHRPQGTGFDAGFDEYLARLFLPLVRR